MRRGPDADFIEQLHLLFEAVHQRLGGAIAAEDAQLERYIRGLIRGLQMAQEAYYTCWNIEELEAIQPQIQSVTLSGAGSPPAPPSDPEDQS